jgi:hypothetical protein
MSKSMPKCIKCSSPVTDSVEVQTEQHEKIKLGHYIDNVGYVIIVSIVIKSNMIIICDERNNK